MGNYGSFSWVSTAWLTFQALILFQESVVASRRRTEDRYLLGCYSAFATLAIGTFIALPLASVLYLDARTATLHPQCALAVPQLVAAGILFVVNLTLPRGPNVYRDGKIVDAERSVSVLNRYTFSWAFGTMALATKNGRLNPGDLPLMAQEVRAKTLSDIFYATDGTSVRWRKWFKLYWRAFITQLVIQLFANAFHFLPHFLLLTVLQLFEDRDAGASNQLQLWLAALGLGLSMMTVSWLISLRDFVADLHLSIPVNEQLLAVITRKAMSLKDTVVTPEGSEGKDDKDGEADDSDSEDEVPRSKHSILNLLGVDVETISDFDAYSHLLLDSVLEFSITIGFLIYLLGWKPTLAGCAIPLPLTPVYYYVTKKYSEKEKVLMDRRDEKSASLTEMVRGIRQIKFSALETEWYSKVLKLRGKEIRSQQDVFRLNIYIIAIWNLGPVCMSFLSLAAYIYLNGSISASTAFTALSLFENLQDTLAILPEVITDMLDAKVSLGRIARFLGLEEHVDSRRSGDKITFEDATITWPSSSSDEITHQFELKGLNLDIPSGGLTIITGHSGSGKSLLLQALVGEADVVGGALLVPRVGSPSNPLAGQNDWIIDGMVAYVSQDPWIENATVRDAILFGLPWNPARYDEVIYACALTPDLKIFPDGDKTDIGAKGINLSGGQKWRLALARALYSRASILVLDDIFSAVDSHVGRHLRDNALTGNLSEGRTRILATHHAKLCLKSASYLVELENGSVVHAGSPDTAAADDPEHASEENMDTLDRAQSPDRIGSFARRDSNARVSKFYEEEKRATGIVNATVYKSYVQASGGHIHWISIVALFVAALVLNLAIPYWVSIWARSYENNTVDSLLSQPGDRSDMADFPAGGLQVDRRLVYYGSVYLAISLVSWFVEVTRNQIILSGSIKASKAIFEQFAESFLRSPIRFLDTTPVGQVMNRFTSDFGIFDSDLALHFASFLHSLVMIVGVIVAAVLTSPLIVGLGVLSLLGSWVVARFYVAGAREAKRLNSVAKSPIFELVESILTGLPTVRAFGREEAYLTRMYDLIDTHCQAFWHRRLFACWMSFWLSLVGAFFVAAVSMIFVSIRALDAPLAGFALSFALAMSDNISWLLSQYAELEISFNAAERIVEYTKLEKEPQTGMDVPAAWPTKGELEVTDLTVAYAPELPPVLQGLNFSIAAGERIGIVGRTGAGKSSLAMTLLRCLDLRSGTIHIDGIDTGKVRLRDLRSRVGMISQDPVVFAGPVREVLDPFNQYDDSELIDALEKVSLTAPSQKISGTDTSEPTSPGIIPLTFPIAESGKNLSQGQRQLLCLARALVSRPKILIMDEATASIDMESDLRIQRVLREEIRGCTLLVIAHRLSTIADFDRIVVLDEGRVSEMDSPRKLMEVEGGAFRGLVEGSGERQAIREMIYGEEA
ncbi:putative ABC transporter [Aspergillus lucknowensis]|uniref:P-loop containing nucleoside triphosphate hydrolase protein n=1 Tax=Aspergillus lucknowensis TaxID=176173 RepID=A0ABR4LDI9_9EURO